MMTIIKSEGRGFYVRAWFVATAFVVAMFVHGAVAATWLHQEFLTKDRYKSEQQQRDRNIDNSLADIKEDIREIRRILEDRK